MRKHRAAAGKGGDGGGYRAELRAACGRSCREATKKYDEDQKKRFGFGFDKEEEGKVLQACGRQCNANCIKSGTGQYNFLIPFRF